MLNQLRSRGSPAKSSPALSETPTDKPAAKPQRYLQALFLLTLFIGACYAAFVLYPRKPSAYNPDLNPVEVYQSQVDNLAKSAVRTGGCTCQPQGSDRQLRQIFVTGMHHSATSPLTMLLTKMGFNAGPRRGLLLKKDNRLKYWEHKGTVKRNQQFINAYYRMHGVKEVRNYHWVGWGFDLKEVKPDAQILSMRKDAAEIIASMDNLPVSNGEPWVIKDPRLSIVGLPWLQNAGAAVCVILLRDPIESAFRFLGYNELPGNYFNVREWGLVWEEYTIRAIANCKATKTPIVFVSYRQFGLDPTAAINQLYDDLEAVGVDLTQIMKLGHVDIHHYLGARWKELHQEKFGMVDPYLKRINRFKFLSPRAINLWQAVADEEGVTASCVNCLDPEMLVPTAWENEDIVRREATEAYAHFVDEVTEESLRKTKVLAASILQFDSSRDLVAIVRRYTISQKNKEILQQQGWIIYYVEDYGEWNGCVSFEGGKKETAQVPELFYSKLRDEAQSNPNLSDQDTDKDKGKDKDKPKVKGQQNTINILSYRVIAFMSPDFLVVSYPKLWFETKEIIASTAGGTLTIVNYQLLKQAGPTNSIHKCESLWQTPFSRAVTVSVANVCGLDPRVSVVDPHYHVVYWDSKQSSLLGSVIGKRKCHAPWTVTPKTEEVAEANNVYVDNWLFLDAIVGKTSERKDSKK